MALSPRLLLSSDVSLILSSRLRLLYEILESYEKSRIKPPRRLTREIAELEARIYDESFGTFLLEHDFLR